MYCVKAPKVEFGPVPIDQALGAVLAHSIALPKGRLRKGAVLTQSHVDAMRDVDIQSVIVARLGEQDVDENTAASRVAAALVPDSVAAGLTLTQATTGRVNLLADGPGVVVLRPDVLNALNALDPMLTLATVPDFHQMTPRGMVGTVKIIAYGIPARI